MNGVPAAIPRIYANNFKPHYLQNKRIFLDFSLHFSNVHEIYSTFKKKMSILDELFAKLFLPKDVAT